MISVAGARKKSFPRQCSEVLEILFSEELKKVPILDGNLIFVTYGLDYCQKCAYLLSLYNKLTITISRPAISLGMWMFSIMKQWDDSTKKGFYSPKVMI